MFGLGWGIGLLATQDIYSNKTVYDIVTLYDIVAALFILLTTFHGVFIFIMHCLRSEKVRKVWKQWFFGVIGRKFVSHKGDTTFSFGNKEATLKSDVPAVASPIERTVVYQPLYENTEITENKDATLKSVLVVDSTIDEKTVVSRPSYENSLKKKTYNVCK